MRSVKIGLYARVSSEKQAQEKTIESQIASIVEHANQKEEKIDPDLHFVDNGISGASLERPGLDRLRDKALAGEVTKVFVLSPDRLSRKSAHQVLLIEEMNRLGVAFAFVNRDIGDTPEDQMLLQMQGVIAEYEREKILERSRRGKLYAAQRGRVNVLSGAPFGYYYKKATDTQDAVYVVHPDESLIVKEAFHLYCNNLSLGEIAKTFTAKSYLTRTGKSFWERSVIWAMLRNPAYKGKAAFRKTKLVKRIKKTKLAFDSKKPPRSEKSSPRERPKEDWIFIPVPAIVDERTFDIAQQRLKENIKFSPRNNKTHNYLLSGLLRCKTCGYAIYGSASNSKYKRQYYRCAGQDGYRWEGGRVCKGHPVRIEAIDELVWTSIRELLLTPETVISEYARRLKSHKGTNYEAIIKQKTNDINRYKRERSRLIDLFQSGVVEKDDIESKLKEIRSKIEQVVNEVDYFESQKNNEDKLLTVIRNLDDFTKNLNQNLDTPSFEEKRKIVRFLVETVEVDSIKEEINVKHIIPLDIKNCQLRPGGRKSSYRKHRSSSCCR